MLLAIVITYAGSGINAYSFCCDDCHTYGVEAISGDKCSDIHQDECSPEQDSLDNTICKSSHQHCTLDRLDIDLQNTSIEKSQNQPFINVLDISFTTLPYLIYLNTKVDTFTGYISQTQKPPNLSNFVYFSLLETLII